MFFEPGTVLVSKKIIKVFLGLDGSYLGELPPETPMLFVGYEHLWFLRYVKVLLSDGRLVLVRGDHFSRA